MGHAFLARTAGANEAKHLWKKSHVVPLIDIKNYGDDPLDVSLYSTAYTFASKCDVIAGKFVLSGSITTVAAGYQNSKWIGYKYFAMAGNDVRSGTTVYVLHEDEGSVWVPSGGYAHFSAGEKRDITTEENDVTFVVDDDPEAFPTDENLHTDGFNYLKL